MPDTSTSSFITILEASKLVRRSERSLQRDINAALVAGHDAKTKPAILEHLVLQIKEGDDTKQVPGVECSSSDAERARDEGKQPTWLLDRNWSIAKYGLKADASVPDIEDKQATVDAGKQPEQRGSSLPSDGEAATPASGVVPTALPDNLDFLKQRIVALEQEKQVEVQRYEREVARNEKREQELFEQLKVKDKQISAWDEISQGLTKGLATGQLRPDQTLPAATGTVERGRTNANSDATEVVTVSREEGSGPPPKGSPKEQQSTKSQTTTGTNGKTNATKRKKSKAKSKRGAQAPKEPPTLRQRLSKIARTRIF